MRVAVFSTKPYDQEFFGRINQEFNQDLVFLQAHLDVETVSLAEGFPVVCPFVNDDLNASVLQALARGGTQLLALRSAGFNHVDIKAAEQAGLTVVRVPAYSPYAIAEHTVGLMLTLNRKIHRAYNRTREGNFFLDGLLGFDMHGKTVGIIGTGKIGQVLAQILKGFGCRILAYDLYPNATLVAKGVQYVSLETLYAEADIISLHCPLIPETFHLINEDAIARMKPGVMLINTSRGGVVDTCAVLQGLKHGRIGSLGLDVYEEESHLFFEDLSNLVIQDDTFMRLLTFPNVLITGHQAFFTREAIENIVRTTLINICDFEKGSLKPENLVASAKQLAESH